MTGRTVHPIEAQSYRILRSTVDTASLPLHTRDVVERIVHTTADPGWVSDLVGDETALAAGAAALRAGARLVVDVAMVAAGITTYPSTCLMGTAVGSTGLAMPAAGPEGLAMPAAGPGEGLTRSAAGIRAAAKLAADGAVWAIGNAPTALFELLRLCDRGEVRPALVIGLPVGFVGAVEAKAALRASRLPQLSNVSARGGAAVAAAAVNALLYGDPLATMDGAAPRSGRAGRQAQRTEYA
jgi:precorrin-8X/cobalt-precorrin-8 methylmutase